jgi:hypothetical protein
MEPRLEKSIFAETLPENDSATRSACQESSAAPGYWVGTAVSVNSFTVDNNLSTAETGGEVNLILGQRVEVKGGKRRLLLEKELRA